VGAVESRSVKELFQLISLGRLDYFFKCHQVGSDPLYFGIYEGAATSVTREVPHVDCKDT
jgi:hypothetical protein